MTAALPGSGPVLQLLASGLQFWIKQQCDAVDQLELQLHGSALQLLRGRLEGVTLVASGVEFAGLPLERVELRSGPIQLQTGLLLKGQAVTLDHPFAVRGQVLFSGRGLDRGLGDQRWRGLADGLAQELLDSVARHCLVHSVVCQVACRVHGRAEAQSKDLRATYGFGDTGACIMTQQCVVWVLT